LVIDKSQLENKLGKGHYAQVWKGTLTPKNGEPIKVACKFPKSGSVDYVEHEFNMLRESQHKYVVKLYGY